jgi:hypothetical protein
MCCRLKKVYADDVDDVCDVDDGLLGVVDLVCDVDKVDVDDVDDVCDVDE